MSDNPVRKSPYRFGVSLSCDEWTPYNSSVWGARIHGVTCTVTRFGEDPEYYRIEIYIEPARWYLRSPVYRWTLQEAQEEAEIRVREWARTQALEDEVKRLRIELDKARALLDARDRERAT